MNRINPPRPNPEFTIIAHELGKPPEAGNTLTRAIKDLGDATGDTQVIVPALEDYYPPCNKEDSGFVVVSPQIEHISRLAKTVAEIGDKSIRLVGLSHGAVVLSKFLQNYTGNNVHEVIFGSALIDPRKKQLKDFYERNDPTSQEIAVAGPGCKASSFLKPRVIFTSEFADEMFGEEFNPAADIGDAARHIDERNISAFGVMAERDVWGGWSQKKIKEYSTSLGEFTLPLYEFKGSEKKSDHFYTGYEQAFAKIVLGHTDLSDLQRVDYAVNDAA